MYVEFWTLGAGDVYDRPLPDVVGYELSPIIESAGAITLDYPANGLNFDALQAGVTEKRDLEIAIWVDGKDAGSLRGRLQLADGDDVDEQAVWRFSGFFGEDRMGDDVVEPVTTIVVPPSGPQPTDDVAAFRVYSATAGQIMIALMQASHARGYLTDIGWDFTPTADSAGVPWANTITLKISPGTSYSDVLASLSGARMCEWAVEGHTLRLWNPDGSGVDYTVGDYPLILHAGGTITEAPRKYTVKDAGTALLVAGADGQYLTVEDPTAAAVRGRKIRRFESQGSISDPGTLAAYANAKLPLTTAGQMEVGFGLSLQIGDYTPLVDFFVRDWIYADVGRGIERLRVAQITITGDQHGVATAALTLNDLIADQLTKQAQRIAGIEGGTTIVGTSNASGGDTADSVPPAKVQGLAGTSAVYPAGDGFLAAMSLSWGAVIVDVNGLAESLAGYRVIYRYTTAPNPTGWQSAGFATTTTTSISGLKPGAQMQVMVAAVDNLNNQGDYSDPLTLTLSADGTAPPVPAALAVTEFNGTLIIAWSGLGSAGEVMPPDFDHINIYRGLTNNFGDAVKTDEIRARPGVTAYDGGGYGTPYSFWATSVDTTGNESGPSARSSGTPIQLGGADLLNGIIDAAKLATGAVTTPAIGAGQVTAANLSVATFGDNSAINGEFEDPDLVDSTKPALWTYNLEGGAALTNVNLDATATNVASGARALRVDTAAGAARHIEVRSTWIPTRPGELWYLEVSTKASRAHAGWTVTFDWSSLATPTDASATQTVAQQDAPFPTAYTQGQFNAVAPAASLGSPTRWVRFKVEVRNNDSAALAVWFDEIRARKVIGTAEIADASIVNAKIALLAVNDANINTLGVGKLTSGTITATITNSGLFQTSVAANRGVKFDNSGVRAYDPSGVLTANIDATGQPHLLTGTTRTGAVNTRRIQINGPTNEIRLYTVNGNDTNFARITANDATYASQVDSVAYLQSPNASTGSGQRAYSFVSNNNVGMVTNGDDTYYYGSSPYSGVPSVAPPEGPYEQPASYVNASTGATLMRTNNSGPADGFSQVYTSVRSASMEVATSTGGTAIDFSRTSLNLQVKSGAGDRGGGFIYLNSGYSYFGYHNSATDAYLSFVGSAASMNGSALAMPPGMPIVGSTGTASSSARFGADGAPQKIRFGWNGSTITFITDGNNAVVKTFVIDHPLDPSRHLVHATVESPETRVVYEGHARLVDGRAEVELPRYFEALTRREGRIVLLTPVLDSEDDDVPVLAATRPRDGRFVIVARGRGDGVVSWWVSAVRADVPHLDAEPLRADSTVAGDGPYTYLIRKPPLRGVAA